MLCNGKIFKAADLKFEDPAVFNNNNFVLV